MPEQYSLLDSYRNPDHQDLLEDWTTIALAAKASDEDTPHWAQATNGPDREGFSEVCKKESDTLTDMFAPIVSWTTVRLMLILSAILDLHTRQTDYTAAFVHAPIDRDPNFDSLSPEQQARQGVYVDMPQGLSQPGKVLRLNSLYGLKQNPSQLLPTYQIHTGIHWTSRHHCH
jgi:hypothetical protein